MSAISGPIPLREYQKELLQEIKQIVDAGNNRILLQLPTGGGKTICFVELIKEYWLKDKRCLVIAHRKELLDQITKKIQEQIGKNHSGNKYLRVGEGIGLINSENKSFKHKITVASVQTLVNIKKIPDFDLVIVDEAHHIKAGSYLNILERSEKSILIGATATPLRNDGQGFKDIFSDIVLGPSVKRLVSENYLCHYTLFAYARQKINTSGIKKTAGDYNIFELDKATNIVFSDIVPTWHRHAKGKRTVVFAVTKEQSKKYANAFNDDKKFKQLKYRAAHIDCDTKPNERKEIINDFKEGKINVLCNVSIISEGFDLPDIECVQVVRPTMSLVLWLQMVGRVLRPYPDKKRGEKSAIVLDHTDNYMRLGLPDADRKWSLDGAPEPVIFNKSLSNNCYIERSPPEILECELIEVYSSKNIALGTGVLSFDSSKVNHKKHGDWRPLPIQKINPANKFSMEAHRKRKRKETFGEAKRKKRYEL